MPMESHRTRWTPDEWAAIEYCAEADGVSVSEIVRIGTMSYVAYRMARRNDRLTVLFDRLWDAARELVAEYPLSGDRR